MARIDQLKALASAFPVANQQTANQLEAARQLQLQQTIGQAAPTLASTLPAQQIGAQQAAQAGANAVQVAKEAQQDRTQLGQLGLSEQGRQLRAQSSDRELNTQRIIQNAVNGMSQLDEKLKNQLLDKQLQFVKDESGRALLNEQQLADYHLSKAKSSEELKNKTQQMEQVWKTKLEVLKHAHNMISSQLEEESKREDTERNRAQHLELSKAKAALENKIKADSIKASNIAARNGAVGTVLGAGFGAVIGAIPTLGVGAGTGAAVGAALGQGISTLGTSKGIF